MTFGSARCPFCLSSVPAGSEVCAVPACGRPLVDAAGARLRLVDARHDAVVAEQRRRYRALMVRGTAVAFGLLLLAPALHVAATPLLAAPLLAAVQLVVLRYALLAPARPLLSSLRRTCTRWVIRAAVLVVGTAGYGFTAVPVLGAAVGAAVFASLTAFAHLYSLRALRHEKERRPLAGWEKGLLVTIVTLVVLASATALFLAWKLSGLAVELFHRLHR